LSTTEIEARVQDVLALVLRLPGRPATPLLRADLPEWDSLSHVEIVYAVEEALGFSFAEDELARLDGSAAIVAAAERHLAA
jgi:acyl carrier protein